MDQRPLGRSGLTTAPLCLGGNVFGWTADESTSFAILDRFVELGFNLIDTANVYSRWVPGHTGGESEAVIGNWLAKSGKRDRVLIATKVGMGSDEEKGLTRAKIEKNVDASLKRLRTDVIDLYQTHLDDPSTPVEETLEALGRLVKAGKVRAIGASQYSPARLRESIAASERLGLPRYETLQPEFNLYDRAQFETEYQPVAREFGLAVIPFFGLAKGFLSGKYRKAADIEGRPRADGLGKYFEGDRGTKILAALDSVSKLLGATPAQVSIAWIMAQPTIAAPIVSATSVRQLDEIAGAARLALDREALAELDRASR
ncbi:MAG TPA: aldo/keto reductase [Usitatibacter sp.]|jgi:aryl-alcohol dehydrogenase-like predicted oxidoreductase|nr:aldo/keto reductase [Usitatibacter sp.]